MKAWVLHDIGNLRFENTKMPKPQEHEVLVKVEAAGICGSDIPRVYRTGTYSFPLVPGHEFSGIVAEAGKCVTSVKTGERVGIFPLIPCKKCVPCQKQQYEMCRHYSYLGSRRNGGFAEYVAVPDENLIKIPGNVSFEASAMLEPMAVAVHVMRRAAILQKDIVAVCGLGTIGLLLFLFLQEMLTSGDLKSEKILLIGNKDFQKETALKMGLPENCYCDSRQENVEQWIMEQTNGVGVDVFFECVGKNETLIHAINSAAPAGKVMLVGNPGSDINMKKDVYWKILRNQLTVMGTWNSSFTYDVTDDWHYVMDRLAGGKIDPSPLITHRYPLQELEQGFHIMRDKTEEYIKIMAVPD